MDYFTYILRCEDGSFYTGFASHICRRMRQHAEKQKSCARYTRLHSVTALAALWQSGSRSAAGRLEYYIKTLTHAQKEQLTAEPEALSHLLGEKLAAADYAYVPDATLEKCLAGDFHEGD
ncbi:MAG: GIY-YIG nuclease family protein [Clostridiales bacterium]|nr:GIY-YIG nuclease family protein [Clostridiales bacterium]